MRREAEKEKEENDSNAELKASDATGVTEEGERGRGEPAESGGEDRLTCIVTT